VEVAARFGVHFIGFGRVRRGGTDQAACRQWWGFNSWPFRGVKGGGESKDAELVRESEGMGGGSLGIMRMEKGLRWASTGPQMPGGPERSGGLKQVDVL
jgi:hypothetical protein